MSSLFKTRRTVKPAFMDTTRELPLELLDQVLEDGHWAPTHGLTQPWRFHVFHGRAKLVELSEALQSIFRATVPVEAQDQGTRDKLIAYPQQSAAAIALLAHAPTASRIPEWEEVAATCCAAQNLMLSAHSHGLGSFWSTTPICTTPEFVRWLGADPESDRALGVVYLGWPKPAAKLPAAPRVPLAERTTWH
ncbi:hypothetical protein AXK11_08910 [Cephaloticoccus primus]|uniref:Nitroreductase domain-containing protein n=1 Tax=Cephaloticoccus primus TaxID=1548207 RepID=A0A139SHU1_9BACT|nr:nitroreductase [Cephaloticoccus primus]KXU34152.1 hypothetical protein AXK11_08910 [Cephaloticoccus primus]